MSITNEFSRIVTVDLKLIKIPAHLRKPVLREIRGLWVLGYRRPNGEFIPLADGCFTRNGAIKCAANKDIRSHFNNTVWTVCP
jgi:hypothetical protein